MRAPAHFLDDEERAEIEEIRFPAPGRSCGSNRAVHIQSGAQNRGIPNTPRNLEREPARSRDAADLSLAIDPIAVDGPIQMFGIEPSFSRHLCDHISRSSNLLLSPSLLRVEIVLGI